MASLLLIQAGIRFNSESPIQVFQVCGSGSCPLVLQAAKIIC